jgi:hypothetical protein
VDDPGRIGPEEPFDRSDFSGVDLGDRAFERSAPGRQRRVDDDRGRDRPLDDGTYAGGNRDGAGWKDARLRHRSGSEERDRRAGKRDPMKEHAASFSPASSPLPRDR